MSKFRLLLRGSSLRVAQTVVSIIVGFIMMPFLIQALGEELYGIWVVVSSIAGSFYLLDVGFSSAVTRFSAKYIHENKHEEANGIISTALVIYGLLGLVVLLVSILLAGLGVGLLVEQERSINLVQILLVLFGVQLALEFPAKALPGVINAFMRYDSIAIIRTLKTVVDATCIWGIISAGYGLVAMAIVCLLTSVVSTFFYVRVVRSLYTNLHLDFQKVSRATFIKIFHFSKWVFVFDMSAMLKQKVDVWLVAYFLGPASLTVYYVAVRLVDYAVKFMLQATDMSTPIFIEYHSSGQYGKLRDSLSMFFRAGWFLSILGFAGFYLVGHQFISLWMPDDFAVEESWELLLILSVARFGVYLTTPFQSMLLTFHRHELSAMISAVELIISGVACIFLIPKFGLVGAALSMAIPIVFSRGLIFPLVIQRLVKFITPEDLLKNTIFFGGIAISVYLFSLYVLNPGWTNFAQLIMGTFFVTSAQLILSPLLIRPHEWLSIKSKLFRRV